MPDERATKEVARVVMYAWSALKGCLRALKEEGDADQRFATTTTTTQSYSGHWGPSERKRMEDHNVRVESLLLHARQLCDFFQLKPKQPDDVLAIHFLDDPTDWSTSELFDHLNEVRNRLNKTLPHFTYAGPDFITKGDRLWQYQRIHDEIEVAWVRFLPKLDEERRAWFE